MRRGTGPLGIGLGAIAAVAAVLLLLPLPVMAGLSGHATAAVGGKAGALNRVGHATDGLVRTTGVTATFGPIRTSEIVAAPSPAAPAGPSSARLATAFAHPTSPQLLGSFTGENKTGAGSYVEPETQVAMNGSYVVEVVDFEIRVTSSTGATVYSHTDTRTFLGTGSTDAIFGNQLLFDLIGHRWYYVAMDQTTNHVYIAVSKTGSPLGTYWIYSYVPSLSFLGTTQASYQPLLGISGTKVTVSTDDYNTSTATFVASIMWFFDKHKITTGTLSGSGYYTGDFAVRPARDISANGTAKDISYLVSTVTPSSSSTLTEFEFVGSAVSLTSSAVSYAIASTGSGGGGVQPGTSSLLATGDDRVLSASWSNAGVLWLSFTVACIPAGDATSHACVRVDAIGTAFNTLSQDTNTAVAGVDLEVGSLTATPGGGGYLMVLSGTSPAMYPEILVSGQNTSDPFSTYRGPIPVFSSSSYDTSGHWGTYSGIQIQVVGSKNTAWGASEYETTAGLWGTEVVHFAFY
jgi:hypothetical protein